MKTIRWIQNVAIVVALIMALSLVDGTGASRKDVFSAFILIVLAMSTLLGRALQQERRNNQ